MTDCPDRFSNGLFAIRLYSRRRVESKITRGLKPVEINADFSVRVVIHSGQLPWLRRRLHDFRQTLAV